MNEKSGVTAWVCPRCGKTVGMVNVTEANKLAVCGECRERIWQLTHWGRIYARRVRRWQTGYGVTGVWQPA